jgi:hypothetical protein
VAVHGSESRRAVTFTAKQERDGRGHSGRLNLNAASGARAVEIARGDFSPSGARVEIAKRFSARGMRPKHMKDHQVQAFIYRQRAEEVRAVADMMTNRELGNILHQVAADYEDLARTEDRLAQIPATLNTPKQ